MILQDLIFYIYLRVSSFIFAILSNINNISSGLSITYWIKFYNPFQTIPEISMRNKEVFLYFDLIQIYFISISLEFSSFRL